MKQLCTVVLQANDLGSNPARYVIFLTVNDLDFQKQSPSSSL